MEKQNTMFLLRIHDEPDISFDAAYFDVGFIGSKGGSGRVVIVIDERLDDKGGSPGIVGDLLVRDADAIQVFQRLCRFTQRQAQIDMHGKAQGHDVGIMFGELQGRGIFRQGV